MDDHAKEFYCVYSDEHPHGHFHRVIALHEEPLLDWEEAHTLVPSLNRGWYELAKLSVQDRIEFTREFWISKLPYHPMLTDFLVKFFGAMDEIGIYLIQKKFEDPFEAQMVYSLANNSGFFHGSPPIDDKGLNLLQKKFSNYILPQDYCDFLKIHDGFSKQSDTGIVCSSYMDELNRIFQDQLIEVDALMTTKGKPVNPNSLIAFYQSYELPFYQCFWGEWYPDQEMGNVYYSGSAKTISDPGEKSDCIETMAFETFIDWLMFYLEQIG